MEDEFIRWLRENLPFSERLRVGLGDDAAVLRWSRGRDCVATSDLLTDGVDFHVHEVDPRRIGRKALAANLSDLAAMAAKPAAAIVSLALPREGALELAIRLYEGMLPLAEEFEIVIAGGDTNTWNAPLAISITALGETTDRGPLLRSGARPGDWILVTGRFGGSILGRHFDFQPRVREALVLHEQFDLHAGVDVSDGLLRDLSHLAEESRCGALLDLHAVPIADAAHRLAQSTGKSPLEHALSDGEDFELILAVGPADGEKLLHEQPLDIPLTRIGEFIDQPGLWTMSDDKRIALQPRGWRHGT